MLFRLCIVMTALGSAAFAQPAPSPYDHGSAEVNAAKAPTITPGQTPIVHQKNYLGERELFDYNPRFMPTSRVAFDARNRPLVMAIAPDSDAGDGTRDGYLQMLGDDGRWRAWPIVDMLKPVFPDWGGRYVAGVRAYHTRIVCDSSGDAWAHLQLLPPGGGHALLRLPQGADEWQVYQIPLHAAHRLELASDGRPPMILSEASGAVLFYELKLAEDGSALIPAPVQLTPEGYFLNPAHSGAGPTAARVGDRTWVTCAAREPVTGEDGEPLPGTAQYVVSYDHTTGEVTEPVLIGFGHNAYTEKPDVHNAGAIVADKGGGLHVVIGAHQHHFWHVRSKVAIPESADDWTEPEALGLRRRYDCGYTYVALAIGADDTLHVVGRNMSRGTASDGSVLGPDEINNADMTRTLDYMRATKQPDGSWKWEELGPLVVAFHRAYSIFYHKLAMDRDGRLFLTYYYYAAQLTPGMAEAYRAKWPGENLAEPAEGKAYKVRPHDPVVIMSDDGGDTWRIATTEDFAQNIASPRGILDTEGGVL